MCFRSQKNLILSSPTPVSAFFSRLFRSKPVVTVETIENVVAQAAPPKADVVEVLVTSVVAEPTHQNASINTVFASTVANTTNTAAPGCDELAEVKG
jgi:fatty acid-binding protein DegV